MALHEHLQLIFVLTTPVMDLSSLPCRHRSHLRQEGVATVVTSLVTIGLWLSSSAIMLTCVWYVVQGGCRLSGSPEFLNWYDSCISRHGLAMNLMHETELLLTNAITLIRCDDKWGEGIWVEMSGHLCRPASPLQWSFLPPASEQPD